MWINFKCVVVACGLLALLHFENCESTIDSSCGNSVDASESVSPILSIRKSKLNAVPPVGWRRTRDGWQHTAQWPIANVSQATPSIATLIASQESQEPHWLQNAMKRIRDIPPLMIALLQIAAIAAILHISRKRRVFSRETEEMIDDQDDSYPVVIPMYDKYSLTTEYDETMTME